jgi:hypothetical protein
MTSSAETIGVVNLLIPHLWAVQLAAHGPRGARDNDLSFPQMYISVSLSVEAPHRVKKGGDFRKNIYSTFREMKTRSRIESKNSTAIQQALANSD